MPTPNADPLDVSKGKAAEMGQRVADKIDVMTDVQKLVKNNPGVALLTAAALGFLIARMFSRD